MTTPSGLPTGSGERQALADLVAALDRCAPGIESAFGFQYIHGVSYTGPSYGEELAHARRVLAASPPEASEEPEGDMGLWYESAEIYRGPHLTPAQAKAVMAGWDRAGMALAHLWGPGAVRQPVPPVEPSMERLPDLLPSHNAIAEELRSLLRGQGHDPRNFDRQIFKLARGWNSTIAYLRAHWQEFIIVPPVEPEGGER